MKALRTTGNVFIVIGATFLFFVLYELVGTSQITRGHQAALAADFEMDFRPEFTPIPQKTPKDPEWPELGHGEIVGRLRIPKLNFRMIIVEGVTLGDLAKGPGHYPNTPYPGQRGSVGVAGHRTGWGSPFINLDKLVRGDEVIIETQRRGTFRYRVTGRTVVDPGQTKVLFGDPDSEASHKLTLTTCTPKYTSLQRLIIWADQVSPETE